MSTSNLEVQHPLYEQVVQATQSGVHVTHAETEYLIPAPPKSNGSDQRPRDPAQTIADPENNATHRIDTQHESHLSSRLKKFLQLSARYAKQPAHPADLEPETEELVSSEFVPAPVEAVTVEEVAVEDEVEIEEVAVEEVAVEEVAVEEVESDSETIDWSDSSRLKAIGYQLKRVRDRLDAAISSQPALPSVDQTKIRVDQPETIQQRKFHQQHAAQPSPSQDIASDQDASTATPVSTGIVWEVDQFHWPEVTRELIADGSLAIDKLGNNALKLMTGVQNRLIVTGTNRGEGVSTIASSLAQWAASLGHRVLLVDADLENAGLTRSVGLSDDISWTQVVNQQCKIGEALVLGKASGIYMMPLARVHNRGNFPSDLYVELEKVVEPISDCFNLVIIDAGPSRQLTQETSRIDLLGDATMLIHDVSRTHSEDFERNKSQLLAYGISKMLVAENFTRDQEA